MTVEQILDLLHPAPVAPVRRVRARRGPPGPFKPSSKKGLLLEALRIRFGTAPFAMEQIVIVPWQAFPRKFGLPGFPEYPDSHVVKGLLYGKNGLVARGYIVPEGLSQWKLVPVKGGD